MVSRWRSAAVASFPANGCGFFDIAGNVRQHVSDSLSRRHERGSFAPLAMSARALHVLCMLVERSGDLVSRGDIFCTVWPETVVDESNLNGNHRDQQRSEHQIEQADGSEASTSDLGGQVRVSKALNGREFRQAANDAVEGRTAEEPKVC